jgi:gamma-glutamylputrescine oxidase
LSLQANPLWPVNERFPALERDASVDVVIVGAGIAGICCGFFLQQAGYRVFIIEREEIGSAATGASSGVLYYGSGTNLTEANQLYGKENATLLWKETEKAISNIRRLVEDSKINCGLSSLEGLMVANNEVEVRTLEEERSALHDIGVHAQLYDRKEIAQFFTGCEFFAGLGFEICAQIQPGRFAAGLASKSNLSVFENSPLESFEEQNEGLVVRTPGAKIRCRKLIVAANLEPFMGIEQFFMPESSVILATGPIEPTRLGKIWPNPKIIWGSNEQYDIIYPQAGRLMLELYRPRNIKEKLSYYYPNVEFNSQTQWGDSWSKTKDYLPIVGEVTPNVYAAVAMGDQGIVMGFLTGSKIQSSLENIHDPILELCSLNRFQN